MAKLHHVIRFGHLIAEMLLLDTTQRYGSFVEGGFYRGLPEPLNFPQIQYPLTIQWVQSLDPSSGSIREVQPVGPARRSSQKVQPEGPARRSIQ